jgi:hypothetical protein
VLVGISDAAASRAARWRRGAWASAAVLLLCLLSLAPYLTASTELVRIRNALVLMEGGRDPFWTPDTQPSDFLQERAAPDPVFAQAAQRLGLAGMATDWERVQAISKHLLSNPNLVGTPIQSRLDDTYRAILTRGTGYCGDFTRVFMGFALAAGMPVRAWSFSFDGFGGHGHIWPEIWNRQRKKWELIDIFDNTYFAREDGLPLSALEVRQAMKSVDGTVRLLRLYAGARPGYEHDDKAWEYYRRGLSEWYLAWGNNVFSEDNALLVRALTHVSRPFEQLGAILQGVYPGIVVLDDTANRDQHDSLRHLRWHLYAAGVVGTLALLSLVVCLAQWRSARRLAGKPA